MPVALLYHHWSPSCFLATNAACLLDQCTKMYSLDANRVLSAIVLAAALGCKRRYVCVVGGGNDNGLPATGRGFSALNTGLQGAAGPLVATAEVFPEPPSDDAFPDPITWKLSTNNSSTEDTAEANVSGGGGDGGDVVATGSGKGDIGTKQEELVRRPPAQALGRGYRSGKWLWEWRIASCGNRTSVGVCGHDVALVSAAGVPLQSGGNGSSSGDHGSKSGGGNNRPDLWVYRSDGHLSHGGESTECVCPGGCFENGDVIGVELDADAGTVAFLKNDAYVGALFKIVGRSESAKAGGLYPCVSLRDSGDAVVLLGLKEGPATITYRPPTKGGGASDGDNKDGRDAANRRAGGGTTAALSAADEAAAAAAEAVAATAASTVGGGEVAALEAAETAAAFSSATVVNTSASREKSDTSGPAEAAAESGAAESTEANTAGDSGASGADSAWASTIESAWMPPPPPPPLPGTSPSVDDSVYPAIFYGEFVRGLKHGPGFMRLSGKGDSWKGKWFQGVQHGVHLLVAAALMSSHPVEGQDDGIPTAWVFDRGVKVTNTGARFFARRMFRFCEFKRCLHRRMDRTELFGPRLVDVDRPS